MKKSLVFICMFFIAIIMVQAQMATDNSYVRNNYNNSKTALKAAQKKAARAARKAAKAEARVQSMTKNATTRPTDYSVAKSAEAKQTAPAGTNYLEGAVATTPDGEVFFEQSFDISGKSHEMVMKIIKSVATEVIAHTEQDNISKIDSETSNQLVATLCEPIYFRQKKWEVDSTLIRYQFTAKVNEQKALVRIDKISYSYESGNVVTFDYPADEWITDEYALTKDKRALTKVAGKFRTRTIDYVNNLFDNINLRIRKF